MIWFSIILGITSVIFVLASLAPEKDYSFEFCDQCDEPTEFCECDRFDP